MSEETATATASTKATAKGKGKGKKRTRRNLNTEGKPKPNAMEFVDHWNNATSRQGVVDSLTKAGFHITYNSVLQREKNYRNKGVDLKVFSHGGSRINVSELNAHIKAQQEAAEAAKAEAEAAEADNTEESVETEA